MSDKVLVVLSGGLDSTTLAYELEARGYEISAISFDYGQHHAAREIRCAQLHSVARGWKHDVIDVAYPLGSLLESALTGFEDVPEGHYADDNMKATIVPNRNAIMLSIATGVAVSRNVPYIATAVHAGDHPVYPDCREEFIALLSTAFTTGNPDFKGIMAPFISHDKSYIAQRAVDLDVNIAGTYSCYKGGPLHCGKCGTCVERMEAIWSTTLWSEAGYAERKNLLFPLDQYEDNTFWQTALEGAK